MSEKLIIDPIQSHLKFDSEPLNKIIIPDFENS